MCWDDEIDGVFVGVNNGAGANIPARGQFFLNDFQSQKRPGRREQD
jgi:hypothetical protein